MNHCYNCDCELDRDNTCYSERNDEYYCSDCYYDTFAHCENCGGEEYAEDLNYIEENDCYYCNSCYDEYMSERENEDIDENSIIKSYHHRDLPLEFMYLEEELKDNLSVEDLLYFGTESEVYNKQCKISNGKMAKMIRETFPQLKLVFEEDGSIGNGFEIISQPMTMAFIKAHKEDFKNMFQMLIDNGFISHNARSCGLHVHFSRNYFKDNEDKYIQKLALFFEQFKEELKTFSRRTDFGWCEFIGDRSGYAKRYLKSSVILKDYAKDHPSHNIAINLGNSSTIEIRIFRGTLKFETYMASVELVNSIVKSVKNRETRKISFDNVVNMKENEFLKDYCELNNIYNSQYLNDDTKNVFKELELKKQKLENVKELCKEEMTNTLKDLTNLTKETTSNIDFENDDIRTTLYILGQINNVLSDKISAIKSEVFNKDDEKIENSYRKYISTYSASNPISYYQYLIDDIGRIVTSSNNELMNKLRDLYKIANENVRKLKNLIMIDESEER